VLNVGVTVEIRDKLLRLFVAIAVPKTVRNEISRVQEELKLLAPRNAVRWTRPEQFHLTLKFLGDVPADGVALLNNAVQSVCAGRPALSLRAKGVGFFPSPRSPRVIWAGIHDGDNRLADLQRGIEDAVWQFAKETGRESFVGHLTLGRLKPFKRIEIEELVERAKAIQDRQFGDWTAQEVEIMRSELSPTGARHTPLAAFQLGD
jgi:RNA 2',3'-cyclic 3'-phosphodiesterase